MAESAQKEVQEQCVLQNKEQLEAFINEKKVQTEGNRTYKDSLFTDLFYSDETAEDNLRSLYNALHPEDPLAETDIIIKKRLENIFFNVLQNDIAGLFKNRVLMFGEHQSTINNNIPVRLFMYAGRVYEQLLEGHKKYGTARIELPTPEFYVFYNGKEDWDIKELKLSDAFKEKKHPFQMDLKVKLINIRAENNHDILKKCDVLNQYSKFVQVYESNKGSSERMEQTIKYCIRHNILLDYIKRKGKEVISMLTAEWNMEEALEVAREEGEISGQRKNEEKMVINLYKAGGKLELIATAAEKSVEEIKQILNRSGVIPE